MALINFPGAEFMSLENFVEHGWNPCKLEPILFFEKKQPFRSQLMESDDNTEYRAFVGVRMNRGALQAARSLGRPRQLLAGIKWGKTVAECHMEKNAHTLKGDAVFEGSKADLDGVPDVYVSLRLCEEYAGNKISPWSVWMRPVRLKSLILENSLPVPNFRRLSLLNWERNSITDIGAVIRSGNGMRLSSHERETYRKCLILSWFYGTPLVLDTNLESNRICVWVSHAELRASMKNLPQPFTDLNNINPKGDEFLKVLSDFKRGQFRLTIDTNEVLWELLSAEKRSRQVAMCESANVSPEKLSKKHQKMDTEAYKMDFDIGDTNRIKDVCSECFLRLQRCFEKMGDSKERALWKKFLRPELYDPNLLKLLATRGSNKLRSLKEACEGRAFADLVTFDSAIHNFCLVVGSASLDDALSIRRDMKDREEDLRKAFLCMDIVCAHKKLLNAFFPNYQPIVCAYEGLNRGLSVLMADEAVIPQALAKVNQRLGDLCASKAFILSANIGMNASGVRGPSNSEKSQNLLNERLNDAVKSSRIGTIKEIVGSEKESFRARRYSRAQERKKVTKNVSPSGRLLREDLSIVTEPETVKPRKKPGILSTSAKAPVVSTKRKNTKRKQEDLEQRSSEQPVKKRIRQEKEKICKTARMEKRIKGSVLAHKMDKEGAGWNSEDTGEEERGEAQIPGETAFDNLETEEESKLLESLDMEAQSVVPDENVESVGAAITGSYSVEDGDQLSPMKVPVAGDGSSGKLSQDGVVQIGITTRRVASGDNMSPFLVYKPGTISWQRDLCCKMGLTLKKETLSAVDLEAVVLSSLNPPLEIQDVMGDGFCFYRALSVWVTGTEEQHGEIRNRVYDFMAAHYEIFRKFELGRVKAVDKEEAAFSERIATGKYTRRYAKTAEVLAAASWLQVDIYVWAEENASWLRTRPVRKFRVENVRDGPANSRLPAIYLRNPGDHYQVVWRIQTEKRNDVDERTDQYKESSTVKNSEICLDVFTSEIVPFKLEGESIQHTSQNAEVSQLSLEGKEDKQVYAVENSEESVANVCVTAVWDSGALQECSGSTNVVEFVLPDPDSENSDKSALQDVTENSRSFPTFDSGFAEARSVSSEEDLSPRARSSSVRLEEFGGGNNSRECSNEHAIDLDMSLGRTQDCNARKDVAGTKALVLPSQSIGKGKCASGKLHVTESGTTGTGSGDKYKSIDQSNAAKNRNPIKKDSANKPKKTERGRGVPVKANKIGSGANGITGQSSASAGEKVEKTEEAENEKVATKEEEGLGSEQGSGSQSVQQESDSSLVNRILQLTASGGNIANDSIREQLAGILSEVKGPSSTIIIKTPCSDRSKTAGTATVVGIEQLGGDIIKALDGECLSHLLKKHGEKRKMIVRRPLLPGPFDDRPLGFASLVAPDPPRPSNMKRPLKKQGVLYDVSSDEEAADLGEDRIVSEAIKVAKKKRRDKSEEEPFGMPTGKVDKRGSYFKAGMSTKAAGKKKTETEDDEHESGKKEKKKKKKKTETEDEEPESGKKGKKRKKKRTDTAVELVMIDPCDITTPIVIMNRERQLVDLNKLLRRQRAKYPLLEAKAAIRIIITHMICGMHEQWMFRYVLTKNNLEGGPLLEQHQCHPLDRRTRRFPLYWLDALTRVMEIHCVDCAEAMDPETARYIRTVIKAIIGSTMTELCHWCKKYGLNYFYKQREGFDWEDLDRRPNGLNGFLTAPFCDMDNEENREIYARIREVYPDATEPEIDTENPESPPDSPVQKGDTGSSEQSSDED